MGLDIIGWVEQKRLDEWEGILKIDAFVGRWIHGFGSMFLDDPFFEPIAKGRGLPNDLSPQAKLDYPEEDWGHTWAYWHEIAAINWDEEFKPDSPSVYKYVRDESGPRLLRWYGYLSQMPDPPAIDFTQDGETVIDDVLYRVVHDPPITRRETLHPGWEIVFKSMDYIANGSREKNEQLRIVVWFNS